MIEQKEEQKIDLNNQINLTKVEIDDETNQLQLKENLINKEIEQIKLFKTLEVIDEHENMLDNINNQYDFKYLKEQIYEKNNDVDFGIQKHEILNNKNQSFKQQLDIYEKYNKEIEDLDLHIKRLQNDYNDEIEVVKENFIRWQSSNQQILLTDTQVNESINLIHDYEDNQEINIPNKLLTPIYQKKYSELTSQKVSLEFKLKDYNDQIDELNNEILQLNMQEEIEPTITEDRKMNLASLKNNNIESKSFYTLLEFDNSLSQNQRNKFEQLFANLKLINALIINEKYQKQLLKQDNLSDEYIFTNKDVDTLTSFNIQENTKIEDLINHFGLSNNSMISWHGSSYDLGIIKGNVTSKETAKYIGTKTRAIYKQTKITELENARDHIKDLFDDLTRKLDSTINNLNELEIEFHNFISFEQLDTILNNIEKLNNQISLKQENMNETNKTLNRLKTEISNISETTKTLADSLLINDNQQAFILLKEDLKAYEKNIYAIENNTIQINSIKQSIFINQKFHDSNVKQFELLENDLNTNIDKQKVLIAEINVLDHQLEQLGIEQIRKRINEIEIRIKEIENTNEAIIKDVGAKHNALENNEKQIDFNKAYLIEQEQVKNKYLQIIQEELSLNYLGTNVSVENILNHRKDNHDFIMSKGQDSSKLQAIFHNNKASLNEYHLAFYAVYNNYDLDNIQPRFLLNAKLAGETLSFFDLIKTLKDDQDNQKHLLDESDKELYEDILIHTISSKIKEHIKESKRWVSSINKFIQEMNTSSSLKLNLKWQTKKADSDNQLEIKELVDLLERDAALLKDSDIKKISMHFKDKIQQARYQNEIGNQDTTFHSLMNEIMDYRTWYEFYIFYDKGLEKNKELTNTKFSRFSGGEKAIAMYVPLFSAVGAKFSGIKKDAPILIALDEAFAAVDDRNIHEMFELISKFDFDYIMDSQSLWGDYSTVKSLAIYELHRPNDVDFVTVIPYLWNGNNKIFKSEGL